MFERERDRTAVDPRQSVTTQMLLSINTGGASPSPTDRMYSFPVGVDSISTRSQAFSSGRRWQPKADG